MNTVQFIFRRAHTLIINDGRVSIRQALVSSARLYVIENPSTDRPYYIGTAENLQARFEARTRTIREMGYSMLQSEDITIFEVQTQINGQARVPDSSGLIDGLDVERLLIRLYLTQAHIPRIRNIDKTGAVPNNSADDLVVRVSASDGVAFNHLRQLEVTIRADESL